MASLRDLPYPFPIEQAGQETGTPFYEKGTDQYKRDLESRMGGLKVGRKEDQDEIKSWREQIRAGVVPENQIELLMHLNPGAAGAFKVARENSERQRRLDQILQGSFRGAQPGFQQAGPVQPQAEPLPQIPAQPASFDVQGATRQLAGAGFVDQAKTLASIPGLAPETAKRKILKDVAGFQRYEDTGERVFPDAERPKKDPLVNVDVRKEHPFIEQLEKKQADKFVEDMEGAESARDSLEDIQKASNIMSQGIITGFGGNFILGAGKLLQQAGMISDDPDNTVANTEAFFANQGKATAQEIKAFGAGTGLSDADREFAKKIAGGEISMTEGSIKKILKLRAKVATLKIKRFNKRAGAVDKRFEGRVPYSMKIELPEVNFGDDKAPDGVDPEDWKYLTEEQKKLWRK